MGITIIIASRVPLVPDAMPANQKPIKRQIIATSLSVFLENLQLARQKIETPKTAIENGMGFPENNATLPLKFSVLCEKTTYTTNVVATEIFA